MRNEAEILAEYLLWHAINTTEIAAIRYRNTQIPQRPSQPVQHNGPCTGRYRGRTKYIFRFILPEYGKNRVWHEQ